MGRTGHKEGCQCRVCLAIDAKALREQAAPVAVAEVEGITLGSLQIGQIFRYGRKMYKKLNASPSMVLDMQDNEGVKMDSNTVVEPIGVGHDVEADA